MGLKCDSLNIPAARLKAVRDGLPVVIWANGVHVATVHPSGHIEHECLRTNWLYRWLGNACRCEQQERGGV